VSFYKKFITLQFWGYFFLKLLTKSVVFDLDIVEVVVLVLTTDLSAADVFLLLIVDELLAENLD
jgi:hypothetical protein